MRGCSSIHSPTRFEGFSVFIALGLLGIKTVYHRVFVMDEQDPTQVYERFLKILRKRKRKQLNETSISAMIWVFEINEE